MVPGLLLARRLHELATGAQEADGLVERQRAGRYQRRVLSERMAGHEGGPLAGVLAILRSPPCSKARLVTAIAGWALRVCCSSSSGPFEDDPAQLEAEELVGAVKQFARGRELLVEVFAHADGLGALTGEDERPVSWTVIAKGE